MLIQSLPRLFSGKLRLLAYSKGKYLATTGKQSSVAPQPRLPPGYNAVHAYALFVKDQLKDSREKASDAIKRTAADWKKMSSSEKNVYTEKSKKITEQKKAEFEKFSDEEKRELLLKNVERKDKNKHNAKMRALHKFREATNKPKQPMGAFMIFCSELRKSGELPTPKGKEEVKSFGVAAGEKWKALSMEQKKVYDDKANGLREAYQKELAEWKVNNAAAIEKWNAEHQKQKPLKKKKVSAKKGIASKNKTKVAARGNYAKKTSASLGLKKKDMKPKGSQKAEKS